MQQISAPQLAELLKHPDGEAGAVHPLLLDVRESWEFETCRIEGSTLISMQSIPARCMELNKDEPTVLICHHGQRSRQVGLFLERQGFTHIINLVGGVAAWAPRSTACVTSRKA